MIAQARVMAAQQMRSGHAQAVFRGSVHNTWIRWWRQVVRGGKRNQEFFLSFRLNIG